VFIRHGISVLLQEALCLVRDVESIVSNGECRVAETRLLEDVLILRFSELLIQLLKERLVCAGWKAGFLVEEGENTELAFDDIDARLVVGEVDELPLDLFPDVFLLLEFEDVGVELAARLMTTS
jgi:hypothetical protein